MRKTVQVEKEQLSCDGCQYLMNESDARIEVSVPFDFILEELRADQPDTLDFHFHALGHRHDCFRYWAHGTDIMKRSLRERGLDDEQIDDFLSLMLYREHSWSPGIDRPKAKASV